MRPWGRAISPLKDQGIDAREVLLLVPANEGTEVKVGAEIDEVRVLLESGFTVGGSSLAQDETSRFRAA